MNILEPELLIIAPEEHPDVVQVLHYLQENNCNTRYYIWDIASFPRQFSCSLTIKNQGNNIFLSNKEQTECLCLDKVKTVWWCEPKVMQMDPDINSLQEKMFAYRSCSQFIDGLSYVLDCLWVNQPDRQDIARNPIYQYQAAKLVDLKILETLVTNNSDAVLAFLEKHGDLFFRPLVPFHTLQHELPKDFFNEIENLYLAPCLFQQSISTQRMLTSLVIGNHISTAQMYWKNEQYEYVSCETPTEIENPLYSLAKLMGLIYFRTYFIVDFKENCYFLSLDSSPSLLTVNDYVNSCTDIFTRLLCRGKAGQSQSYWPNLSRSVLYNKS